EQAFRAGVAELSPGRTEAAIAARFQAELHAWPFEQGFDVERAGGFVGCMSGPRSTNAHGSHARSSSRRVERGELVMVHMNSYADGYWTDLTRSYVMGPVDEKKAEMFQAIARARAAAMEAIRP